MVTSLLFLAVAQLPPLFFQDVRWSPNGRSIAFTAAVGGTFGIYTARSDGSHVKKLSPAGIEDMYVSWSPNGKSLLFSRKVESGRRQLFTVSTDGKDLTRITHDDGDDAYGDFSPDGKRIVYMSGRGGHDQIFVADVDGASERQITHSEKNDYNPAWSPKGDWIAFETDRFGKGDELVMVRPDGSAETRVTDNEVSDTFPQWAPSGKELLHNGRSGDNAGLHLTDLSTKASRLVVPHAFFGSVSRNGKKIAAIGYIDGASGKFKDRTFFLEVSNADGSHLQKLDLRLP